MGFKKWVVSDFNKELAKELAVECDVDPIVSLIASARGYSDPMELEQFLSDEPVFSNPQVMTDILLAAEIINAAIEDKRKIAIFGDYDCDGVTATALMVNYLKSRDADCVYYIPDRFNEGYGMNEDAICSLHNQGVQLIITVDNGISAIHEIELAKSLGMDVVVTDHHLPKEVLPQADAVVDPHRKDCPSEFKDICGAQVAFRLVCVMENKEPEELLPQFADLLTLAVMADLMPLTLENRSIVKCGIKKLKTAPLTGLSALMSVAGLEQKSINATKVAFGLCPRINAAGRMGDAARALELLICDNMLTALGIANEIDGENSHRQQTEKEILKEAINSVETNGFANQKVIVCEGKNWHQGIVGIVAAKITEKYGKPSVLITVDDEGNAHGSGRSVEGFPLFDAINSCEALLEKFGGHEQAAGVSLREENIGKFRKYINEFAENLETVVPVLHIDCRLNVSALNVDLASAIKSLEPYGSGNPAPLFGIWGVKLERVSPISSGKHLRLLFSKNANTFTAMLFGVSPQNFGFEVGDVLDIAAFLDENVYKGEVNLTINIKSLRKHGTDDDKLFKELYLWDKFLQGKEDDYSLICPTREEVGAVYRYILQGEKTKEKLEYYFINSLGLGKTLASIKILQELSLLKVSSEGFYVGIKTGEKTNLELSKTYIVLKKGEEI